MSDHGLQVQIFIPPFAFTEGSIKSPNITWKNTIKLPSHYQSHQIVVQGWCPFWMMLILAPSLPRPETVFWAWFWRDCVCKGEIALHPGFSVGWRPRGLGRMVTFVVGDGARLQWLAWVRVALLATLLWSTGLGFQPPWWIPGTSSIVIHVSWSCPSLGIISLGISLFDNYPHKHHNLVICSHIFKSHKNKNRKKN